MSQQILLTSHSTSLPVHGQHVWFFFAFNHQTITAISKTHEKWQPGNSSHHYQTVCTSPVSRNVKLQLYLSTVTRPIRGPAPVSNQQILSQAVTKLPAPLKTSTNNSQQLRYGMNVATRTGPDRAEDTWHAQCVSHARSRLQPVCLPSSHCRAMRQASTSLLAPRSPHHPAIGHACHQYSTIGWWNPPPLWTTH
jgi:hypothetical protein